MEKKIDAERIVIIIVIAFLLLFTVFVSVYLLKKQDEEKLKLEPEVEPEVEVEVEPEVEIPKYNFAINVENKSKFELNLIERNSITTENEIIYDITDGKHSYGFVQIENIKENTIEENEEITITIYLDRLINSVEVFNNGIKIEMEKIVSEKFKSYVATIKAVEDVNIVVKANFYKEPELYDLNLSVKSNLGFEYTLVLENTENSIGDTRYWYCITDGADMYGYVVVTSSGFDGKIIEDTILSVILKVPAFSDGIKFSCNGSLIETRIEPREFENLYLAEIKMESDINLVISGYFEMVFE